MRRIPDWLALCVILALAAAARVWFSAAGVPHAVGLDEPQVVDRAVRILHTGEWNPHLFDVPTLVVYLQAGVAILRFLWGAVNGEWATLDAFSITAVYGTARLMTAAIGVATVWLLWRLARDLSGRAVALLAAVLLAVNPLHVGESHYVLTDVPMTALTTLALWLAVRAARLGTVAAYALAGAACGLAAAANYNGAIVLVAVAAAWLLDDRSPADRGRKAAAIAGAAALAFLIAAPFTLLDMPAFLDGFAAQSSRAAHGGDRVWLAALKLLGPPRARWWMPASVAGVVMLLWRDRTRRPWTPVILFAVACWLVLSAHAQVFDRTALPLVPPLCLFAAVAVVDAVRAVLRLPALPRPIAARVVWPLAVVGLLWADTAASVRWLDAVKRPDTRMMASDWLKTNVPRGMRVAVEGGGPAYLDAAGFRVVPSEILTAHPLDWYRQRADYLVISAPDSSAYADYVSAGPTVLQIGPTPQRRGPPIRIVALRR